MVERDDRIFRATRIAAAAIVPFLILAFIILYLFPSTAAERFAWDIQPPMTAMYMGAGYLGGAWLFANAIFGRRWHRVAAGFPPVTAFTIVLLLATIVHRDRFDPGHLPFQIWLVLYIITPVLVPWLWWRNRATDPGGPEPGDVTVPAAARRIMQGLGVVLLAFAAVGFVSPETLNGVWPWALTPLTARVMAGWFTLLAVGNLAIGRESRWSAWRVPVQSIVSWHVLVLIAAAVNAADFTAGLVNWYVAAVVLALLGIAALYVRMEARRGDAPVAAAG